MIFQLLSWIRKVGEETLNSQTVLLRTAASAAGVKTIEKSFENFYFNALVSMELMLVRHLNVYISILILSSFKSNVIFNCR